MYGLGTFHALPQYGMHGGLRTEFGNLTPPGGKVVAYVHNGGGNVTDDEEIRRRLYKSVAECLHLARAGKLDTIFVLPGHTESLAIADSWANLVAGTRIVGLGYGNARPTFTWTAAGSTLLLNAANVHVDNCVLNMDPGAGTVNVAAPITVSAAGCRISRCTMRMGTDANSKVTIGITTAAGADDLTIEACDIYGATAAEATTLIQFVAANRLRFIGNSVVGATSAVAVGVIRFLTTASTFIKIYGCQVRNTKALSEQAITGMAAISGEADHLFLCTLDGVAPATSTAFSTLASMQLGLHVYACTLAAERANNYGTVSA